MLDADRSITNEDFIKAFDTNAKALIELRNQIAALQSSVEVLTENLRQTVEPLELQLSVVQKPVVFNFPENFMAGAIALPTAFAFMHPVDTIKTQMQAHGSNGGFLNTLRSALRNVGPSTFARGFASSVLGAVPQGGLRLGTYGFAQRELRPYFDSPILLNAVSAVAGDISSSVVKVPREIITQQLQTGMHKNVQSALASILRVEGIRGLFTGFWSTTSRDIPFMVVLFVSYEQFKQWKVRITTSTMRSQTGHDHPWSDAETILWGGISGGLAGFSTTPFDVLKTRIMTSSATENRTMRAAFSSVLQRDGLRGLFVGAMPRSVWWFCVCSIFFPSFERLREVFKERGF